MWYLERGGSVMPARRRRNKGGLVAEFPKVIHERRLKLGLGQAEIAAAIRVASPEFISMVERGTRKIDLDRIPDLARVLQYDAGDLCRLALREQAPVLYEALFPGDGGGPPRDAGPASSEPILVPAEMGDLVRRLGSLPAEVRANIDSIVRFLYGAYLKGSRLPGGLREDLSHDPGPSGSG